MTALQESERLPGIPKSFESATLFSLREMMTDMRGTIALYELRELCRNPEHRLFGDTQQYLQGLSLLQDNGHPHQSVKEIVNEYVTGEGLEMYVR